MSKTRQKIYASKTSKSFYDWCIEHNHTDLLNRWDYNLNELSPMDVSYATHNKYWFKCPNSMHASELKEIKTGTITCINHFNCKQCNSFAQYLIDAYGDNALNLYWDDYLNDLNPWMIDKSSGKTIFIKCQEKQYHNSYKTKCSSFYRGDRCPYCYGKQVHKMDSLGYLYPEVFSIWSSKNELSPYDFLPMSNKKVWWKCNCAKHGDYFRSVLSSKKYQFRCPDCVRERTESFLQEKVRIYLEKYYNYTVLHEYGCDIVPINPKTNYPLPFDNELKELKLIVEVNGEQHYKSSSIWIDKWSKRRGMTEDECLHYMKLKDRYKKYVACYNGYAYIEIPYWAENNDLYKEIIDNEISSRLSSA